MRGEIDADTAKELDAMQWQKDFYRSRELLDEEPEWGGLLGLEARATSLEMRVTALEESREVEDG
ncbi:MAG: hypothetical protein GWN58_11180 [Anaerolineae bacterium]|nr:hypothetical protein [Anaerolineae bacterium]